MTEGEFFDLSESYQGYCTTCQQITCDCVEPDVSDRICPDCGQPTVCGMETALLLEEIIINN